MTPAGDEVADRQSLRRDRERQPIDERPGVAGYLLEHGVPGPNGVLLNEALAVAIRDSGLDAPESARIDLLLATLLFADAQNHDVPPAPTSADHPPDAPECVQHDVVQLAWTAPLATEHEHLISGMAPGDQLDWVIEVAIAHIRAVTRSAPG